MRILSLVAALAVGVAVAGWSPAYADEPKKIVLQLTDGSAEKHALVLNVAGNLLKSYGEDASIEIVAFGPGLPLLLADSSQHDRVRKLAKRGVRFSACRNTLKKVTALAGKRPPLAEEAVEVSGGAQRIIKLVEQGYILIRP